MSAPLESVERAVPARITDYLELTKPRLSSLVLLTATVGFVLAVPEGIRWARMVTALVGIALVVGGANALNQYAERDLDARMDRTRDRPLPDGRLLPVEALAFGALSSGLGLLVLVALVNGLTAALATTALVTYVLVYTPLKRKTPLSTLVGAVPGALPPLIGWAAARGGLEPGAWALFAILFLWQPPHFLAIARIHERDYARGGYPLLGRADGGGPGSALQGAAFCAVLIPATVLPTVLGLTGFLYLAGSLLLGVAFLATALAGLLSPSRAADRRTFFASLIHLTGVMILLLVDMQPLC